MSQNLKSRRMIEAFRLGIVPYDCVEEFTFGRTQALAQFKDWLERDEQAVLLMVGEYGAGKTHMLHYAYAHALRSGYAVAFVEMDANESPFYRPKRVYHQLAQSLRFQETARSIHLRTFRDLIREALNYHPFEDHLYLKHLGGRTIDETIWDWIEGRDVSIRPPNIHESLRVDDVKANFGVVERRLQRMEESLREVHRLFDGTPDRSTAGYRQLPGLYPYYKAANIYCYLLSGLGWAARELLQLRGLLLIFDEAENVDRYDNLYQADKNRNFLRALLRTAKGDPELLEPPAHTGLDYCRVGVGPRVPFLYRPESGLKLLFGWTPVDMLDYFPELRSARRLDLPSLPKGAQRELFLHLALLYQEAYGDLRRLQDHEGIESIFEHVAAYADRTRFLVKGSVEALDLIRTRGTSRRGRSIPLEELLQW